MKITIEISVDTNIKPLVYNVLAVNDSESFDFDSPEAAKEFAAEYLAAAIADEEHEAWKHW